jgi:hypothetical protein
MTIIWNIGSENKHVLLLHLLWKHEKNTNTKPFRGKQFPENYEDKEGMSPRVLSIQGNSLTRRTGRKVNASNIRCLIKKGSMTHPTSSRFMIYFSVFPPKYLFSLLSHLLICCSIYQLRWLKKFMCIQSPSDSNLRFGVMIFLRRKLQ